MQLIYDFSFLLVLLAAVTGVVWGADAWLIRRRRPAGAREPVLVEYARSFFPIILIVLVIRSFLFEPFRIPSDSMMPTLLDGDFIFVNKFSYGLRLPVLNTRLVEIGRPERGDVIVFRKPSDPSVNYIKRLVGLPGDRVEVRGDAVWVNGIEMKARDAGLYTEDVCYQNYRQGLETLGGREHRIMYCPVDPHRAEAACGGGRNLYQCDADPHLPASPAGDQSPAPVGVFNVPPGFYFFMGDNRDNSGDSRFPEQLGYVPEANLIGKAVAIWMSFERFPVPRWGRIAMTVH